ncbi:MAG: 1-(5-phosphoribosyl)-5-[(5-phosphoribosylamino)methylideneamino]imidazole-4-carboxamide isomerase [Gemmatimonadaceae bacterium]
MIVIPAVDLRDGCCVQLVGGSFEKEMVRLDDPVGIARKWETDGFRVIHVVDLDAAMRTGSNADVVESILRSAVCEVQVGGGIRDEQQVEDLLLNGATRVILGTRAIEDPFWLSDITSQFPGSIIVAADTRDRSLVTRGWTRTSSRNVLDLIHELNDSALAGVLVTAVHREGQLEGPDFRLVEDVVAASSHPVFISGGIRGMSDLHSLEEEGVAASIVGMAIYAGTLDPKAAAEEFST